MLLAVAQPANAAWLLCAASLAWLVDCPYGLVVLISPSVRSRASRRIAEGADLGATH